MTPVTFITGNQSKARYLAKYLGFPVEHVKLDLDEIQSLSLSEIVEHKARQAYQQVQKPVIVEDVALEFAAFGRLPGTFIKYFVDEVPGATLCSMLGNHSREATARCVFGYYDGERLELLEGSLKGRIAEEPAGENGFGWDRIFIPQGYEVTKASLGEEDYRITYTQIKPFAKLKALLEEISGT